jgi:hypothetical protein
MKLSRTRLRPALSKSISSLLPSISAMLRMQATYDLAEVRAQEGEILVERVGA